MNDDFQGRALAVLLQAKMRRDELSLALLARRLVVGTSYLSQLLRGVKSLAAVNDEFLRASAEYLEMPAVLVYLLAGRLQAPDFFVSPVSWQHHVDEALREVAASNVAAETAISSEMLMALPDAVKLLVVLLYERSEHVLLLPKRIEASEIEALGQSYVPFEVRLHKSC
jgi:hypothetical protein